MGNNLDLCQMLGAPADLKCPRCRRLTSSFFDDYDVDCGDPNPRSGVWELQVQCTECGHNWECHMDVKLTKERGT